MKQAKYNYCIYLVKWNKIKYVGQIAIHNKRLLNQVNKFYNEKQCKILSNSLLYHEIYTNLQHVEEITLYHSKLYSKYYDDCIENNEEAEPFEVFDINDTIQEFCKNITILQISTKENLEQDIDKWILLLSSNIYGLNNTPKIDNNNINKTGKYVVYKHTSPKNKVYIGITGQDKPSLRWKNGNGYKNNKAFYKDIQLYGWESFTHEILETNLTIEKAWEKEIYYIEKYNSFYTGYNNTKGGNSYPM